MPAADEDLAFLPAHRLSALLRARKLTSTRLTELYLARLQRLNPTLNCVVTLLETHALAEARKADAEIAAAAIEGRCTACRTASRTSSRPGAFARRGACPISRIGSSTRTRRSSCASGTPARPGREAVDRHLRAERSGSAAAPTTRGTCRKDRAGRQRDLHRRSLPAASRSRSARRRRGRSCRRRSAAASRRCGRRLAVSVDTVAWCSPGRTTASGRCAAPPRTARWSSACCTASTRRTRRRSRHRSASTVASTSHASASASIRTRRRNWWRSCVSSG